MRYAVHSDELQSHSEKNAQLKSLIDAIMKANTKLISTLNELSEAMKALNELLKRFTSENAHLNISPANSVIKVLIKISKAQNADHHATAAHFAYIKALIKAK